MIQTKKRGVFETPYLTADILTFDLSTAPNSSSCSLCAFEVSKNEKLSLPLKIIMDDACINAPCLGANGMFFDNVKILSDKFKF